MLRPTIAIDYISTWLIPKAPSSSAKKARTHNFSTRQPGQEYILETTEAGRKGAMTAQQAGVQVGDCLKLNVANQPVHYRVEAIDYYADPPDMWTASLVKVAD